MVGLQSKVEDLFRPEILTKMFTDGQIDIQCQSVDQNYFANLAINLQFNFEEFKEGREF